MRLRPAPFDRLKLIPLAALVSAFALILAGALVTLYEEQLYQTQKIDDTSVQGQILAASVTAALVFDDEKAAQEYVNALQANPDLEAVGVYSAGGARVAGFTRAGSGEPPAAVEIHPPSVSNNRIFVTLPVRQGNSTVGTVYLRATMDSFPRRMVRDAGIILLVVMGVLVLVVLGGAQRALMATNRRLQDEMENRSRTEEALRQSQKMEAVGQLSGGIAHDFNNLLTIIKGNLQLMQKRMAEGRTDVQRYCNAAIEGLNRAASLTQRILAFSRRQPLSPKPIDLSGLVGDLRELIARSISDPIRLETRLAAKWTTLCDANQMENVILNLVINARDAMPDGGEITIETGDVRVDAPFGEIAPGDYVRRSVRDTGMGMSDEVRLKAVDPFFTTKPPGRGTGLGLSTTFGYVRQSNGHLTIESALGRGTVIVILMPRYNMQAMVVEA